MTIDEEQATGEAMIKLFSLKKEKDTGHYIIPGYGGKTPVGVCRTVQRIIDLKGEI
jgi:hypothetical protein